MTYYSVDPVLFGVGVSGSTATLGVNDPEIGTRISQGELDYLFVYNAGGQDIAVGQPVCLSGVTGYSVTVSCVSVTDFAIGVRQHSTLPSSQYGWVATKGIGTIEMDADASCATGELLMIGNEGFAQKSTHTFETPGIGKALESLASGASGIAYFSLF